MRSSVGQLEEGIFHLDLILQDGLLDIVEVLAIGGSEVDRCIIEERRCLGQGVDKVAKIAEVLNDLRQGCRLAGARTACEGDAGDIFIHL